MVWLDQMSAIMQAGPEFCSHWISAGAWRDYNLGLVCGVSIPQGELQQHMINTGLIHLMVVSGSHLVFIEMWMRWLPRSAQLGILSVYSWLVGFQAPVVRALIRRFTSPYAIKNWGLSGVQIEALTALVTVMIVPEWLESRSFLMSWTCAIALSAPRPEVKWGELLMCTYVYIMMLPFCWGSPLSILWNWLLAPIVGFGLLPLVVLGCAIHPLQILSDTSWQAFAWTLENGPQSVPADIFTEAGVLKWWTLSLQVAVVLWEVAWRRRFAFSSSP